MASDSALEQLLPNRHPEHDLFICDVADATLKDLLQEMEHPFYALSKKPETTVRNYEHNGNWIKITPSVQGLATIYDKDILIYCISQIMHKLRNNTPVSKRVRINSHDLLIFTNRGTSGRDYMALAEALERIRGTTITTNIKTGDKEQTDTFGLIESSTIGRKHGLDGRMLWCEVTLSDWVFNAIRAHEVLTLHRDYFRLRKPLERRVYEIARKHCDQQKQWKIGLPLLLKKTGSLSPMKRFRQMVRNLVKHDHLPDYRVSLEEDIVTFVSRETIKAVSDERDAYSVPPLKPSTFEQARKFVPGCDVYFIEQEWRDWLTEPPRNPDLAFLGFCRKWYEKRSH